MSETIKQNRHQRRVMERINQEASEIHNQLCDKFMSAIIASSNPDSEAIILLADLGARWKMYCSRRNLIPSAFGLVEQSCQKMLQEYKNNLKINP
jgi:hypothetical protein